MSHTPPQPQRPPDRSRPADRIAARAIPFSRDPVGEREHVICTERSPVGSRLNEVLRFGTLAVLVCAAVGCKTTLDMSAFRNDDDDLDRIANIDGVRGPLERSLQARRGEDMHRLGPIAGEREFEAAKKLFDDGDYKAAESEFKTLAKKYDETPVEEDAKFYLAECKYNRGHYPGAQDQYMTLIEEFPSTRHLETATKRLFDIGREWLGFPKQVETSEVQVASFENPSRTPPPKADGGGPPARLLPNFFNKKRPVFDTEGRGLEALRSIWLNDPTGPLADDALMLTASHNLRKGNYQEADYLFTLLREEYPDSPHLEKAFVLGSHVKLMSYQGAAYDGQSLAAAEDLKKSALRLFPDTETRDRIHGELEAIQRAKEDREWELVKFWQRKGNDRAVAMQCREVIRLYPDSEYAQRARAMLKELPAEAVRLATPLRPVEQPSLLSRVPSIPNLLPIPGGGDADEEDPFGSLSEGDDEVRDAIVPDAPPVDAIGEERPRDAISRDADRPVDAIGGGPSRLRL